MIDSFLSPDSFVSRYSNDIPSAPEASEIDFLLEKAEEACSVDSFDEAHTLLKKALSSIKEKEEADAKWADQEVYYNDIVRIYTELMPDEYNDSIPDEISILVFQKRLSSSLDTLKLTPNDSVVLSKLACQKGVSYNFPIVWNDRVYRSLYFFSKGRKGPLDRWLLRSGYYLPLMQRMFSDSGLPTDLAYLPLIESGFNPSAYSRRRAAGIWQFIASTGSLYGLRKNYWLDERRDPVKSTLAAVSYLKKLYNQFNDWYCSIAAYNCGENGMANAISKASTSNYWRLSLPRETRNYVPEFISALIVAKNAGCFGYSIAPVDTFNCDTAIINECINLHAVCDELSLSFKELRQLNPHLLRWCSPPNVQGYSLYLPRGTKDRFTFALTQNPGRFLVSWYAYHVHSGEKLSTIARHFKVSQEAIKNLNKMNGACRLSVGQAIFIPIPVGISQAHASAIAEDLIEQTPPRRPTTTVNGQIRYRVRPGDTIWDLARLFHIPVRDICEWNGIAGDQGIKAGQVLVLNNGATGTAKKSFPQPAVHDQNASVMKYRVQKGDNLYSIAKKLNVAVADLAAWNSKDGRRPVIFPDEELAYYPEKQTQGRTAQSDTVFYRVCKGDNLTSLAAAFSVSVTEIMQANNLTQNSTLKIGDLIKIPAAKRTSLLRETNYGIFACV